MAEKIKDEQDRLLDSLFRPEHLADDGFSVAVVARVKRRLWLRRLLLPTAAAMGGSIAIKPIAALIAALKGVSFLIPLDLVSTTADSIPQLPMIILGAMLLAVCMLGAKVLQE